MSKYNVSEGVVMGGIYYENDKTKENFIENLKRRNNKSAEQKAIEAANRQRGAKLDEIKETEKRQIDELNKEIENVLVPKILTEFDNLGGNNLTLDEVKNLMAKFNNEIQNYYNKYAEITANNKENKITLPALKQPKATLYRALLKKSAKFLIVASEYAILHSDIKVNQLSKQERKELLLVLETKGVFNDANFAKNYAVAFGHIEASDITLANVKEYLKYYPENFRSLNHELKNKLFGDYDNILREAIATTPFLILGMNSEQLDYVASHFGSTLRNILLKDVTLLNYNMFYNGFFKNPEHTAKSIFHVLTAKQLEAFAPYFEIFPEIEEVYANKKADAHNKNNTATFRSSEQGI